jgi:pimeloyl-ACP methyl ester carboxylesterase
MPVVRANGVALHCQTLGPELGAGPLVTMLHGLVLGNLATWYFTAAHGISKRHSVLLYDLRGHGKSERVETGYDLATMVGDLEGLLEATGVPDDEPLSLVGHSYGGLVALRFALAHPGRVARLALVDVPLSPASIAVGLEPDLEAEGDALFAGLPEFLQQSLSRGSRRARHLVSTLELLLKRATLLADLKAEAEVTREELASITCPVLCLYGDASWFLPDSETYAAWLPDARRVVIPGRHHLPIESAALVTAHLEEFFHG